MELGGVILKKLLSMLLALFVALFNNVSYTATDDKDYTADSYYTVDVQEAPDYRDIYNSNATASKLNSCRTTNYSAQGRLVKYTDDVEYKGYWFENSTLKNQSDIPDDKKFVFTSDCYIIIPFDGELVSESNTNSGHDMIVNCNVNNNKYRLTISNMSRWYCCMGRNNVSDMYDLDYAWVHTSVEQQGKQFKQGNVLGMGVKDKTTIVVEYLPDKGDPVAISLQKFYKGETP